MLRSDLLKSLTDPEKSEVGALIAKRSKLLEFKRAQTIYRQGDAAQGLYLIEQGLVGLVILGQESGKEHLLRLFKAGDFFGHRTLFRGELHHASAVALEATRVLFLEKDGFLELIDRHPKILRSIVEILADELGKAERIHVDIIESQILARTAHALVYLKDVHPDHNWTRQEIANFCASTVSTIIKTLAELEEMGYIEQDGRIIRIKNRDALLAL